MLKISPMQVVAIEILHNLWLVMAWSCQFAYGKPLIQVGIMNGIDEFKVELMRMHFHNLEFTSPEVGLKADNIYSSRLKIDFYT